MMDPYESDVLINAKSRLGSFQQGSGKVNTKEVQKPHHASDKKKIHFHSYIERKKRVCGGRPVIKGTRFPVSSVAIQYQRGLSAEDIRRDYPQLSLPQVYGALAYYFDHQVAVEAEVAHIRHREQQMSWAPTLRLFGEKPSLL